MGSKKCPKEKCWLWNEKHKICNIALHQTISHCTRWKLKTKDYYKPKQVRKENKK